MIMERRRYTYRSHYCGITEQQFSYFPKIFFISLRDFYISDNSDITCRVIAFDWNNVLKLIQQYQSVTQLYNAERKFSESQYLSN